MSFASILYIHTAPQPRIRGTDAVYQEVKYLRDYFGGESIGLFPFKRPNSTFPIGLYGWHKIGALRKADRKHSINHIFAPRLIDFPVLQRLQNPTVYSVMATLTADRRPKRLSNLKALAAIVVNNAHNLTVLKSWGFDNIYFIPTGIDVRPFSKQRLPFTDELRLLMASAPWERSQFASKGVDLILGAVKEMHNLHVTFLWRDFLADEMVQRIHAYGLREKISLINKKVNIQEQLSKVHGMVLLAQHPELVKSNPHSLIESILCGKPVITSKTIPMSEIITSSNCGLVINEFTVDDLISTISEFARNYKQLAKGAYDISPEGFDQQVMVRRYSEIYEKVTQHDF